MLGCILALALAAPPEFGAGHILIACDGSDRVVELDALGAFVREIGDAGAPVDPWDVAFGPDGRLYVSSPTTHSVLVYGGAGDLQQTLTAPGEMIEPRGLAFGPGGRLFVACRGSDRVVVFGAALQLEGSLLCPAGNGAPSALAFDHEGGLWMSSDVSGGALRLEADGVASASVRLPALATDFGHFGNDFIFVALAGAPGFAVIEAKKQTSFEFDEGLDDVAGVAEPEEGGRIASNHSTDELLYDGVGPFGSFTVSDPHLHGPRGIAMAPWRFDVTLKGRAQADALFGESKAISGRAVLSLYGGERVAMLAIDAGSEKLLDVLGASVFVIPLESGSDDVPGIDKSEVSAQGTQLARFGALEQLSLVVEHRLAPVIDAFTDVPSKVKDPKARIQFSRTRTAGWLASSKPKLRNGG